MVDKTESHIILWWIPEITITEVMAKDNDNKGKVHTLGTYLTVITKLVLMRHAPPLTASSNKIP